MNKEQQCVKDWMTKFGQDTPPTPVIPSLEIRKLRAKLILEEALETISALNIGVYLKNQDDEFDCLQDIQDITFTEWDSPLSKPDLTETADGIADSLVVLLGTAVACGIDIEPVFEEVMRSNDSKLWTENELNEAKKIPNCKYIYKEHWITNNPRRFIVMLDGKVIKSPSYSPANILPILKEQGLL